MFCLFRTLRTAFLATAGVVALPLLAGSSPAFGTPLPITNANFESLVLATPGSGNGEGFALGNPGHPGWTTSDLNQTGISRFFGTNDTKFPGGTGVYDHSQVAFVSGHSHTITSDVIAPITAGMSYTLTVQVGARTDQAAQPNGYRIQLLANGVALTPTTSSLPSLAAGDFKTATLTYSAADLTSFIGQNLSIRLGRNATAWQQSNFDNVALDAVPEPAVLGLAPLTLMALRRRRVA